MDRNKLLAALSLCNRDAHPTENICVKYSFKKIDDAVKMNFNFR